MKLYRDTPNNRAASALLLVSIILITACTNRSAPPATAVEAPINPTSTARPFPPTATPAASPTLLPPTATSIPEQENPSEPASTPTQGAPTAQATEQPQATATLITKIPASSGVEVYETTVTIPSYLIRDYLTEQIDPVYNIPVYYFNRSGFETGQLVPVPVGYTGIVLENPYLRLTFLPELGGRLYSAVIKATNQELFYHNPVVKPSQFGGLQPPEANWWLATGGMEWAYPIQEHGYRFGVPWDYQIKQTADGATLTLSDAAPDRVSLSVDVTLAADSAIFTVSPTLTNNGPSEAPIQLWTNAAMTLGSDSMSPNTRFIVPADKITVHSRGEQGWTVPDAKQEAPWPQGDDTNLSFYNEWTSYLGFFVPNQAGPFLGAYNPDTDFGIVRLPAPELDFGSSKLFAFGADFPAHIYTDGDTQYFEIWGGANDGFWPEDDILVPIGQSLGWTESWWPLAQLGGITWATETIAIHLAKSDDVYTLSARLSHSEQGFVQVQTGDTIILDDSFSVDPDIPLQWDFTAADEAMSIHFFDNAGTLLLAYQID